MSDRLTVEHVEAQHVNVGDEVWAHNRFRRVESAGPTDAVTDRISLEFRAEESYAGLFAAVVQPSDKVLRLPLSAARPSSPGRGTPIELPELGPLPCDGSGGFGPSAPGLIGWQACGGCENCQPARPSSPTPEETRELVAAMREAIGEAYAAMRASEYVGGPTEREAWRTVLSALWPFVTNAKGMTDPGDDATTKEGR